MALLETSGLQLTRDDLALLAEAGDDDDVVLALQVLFPDSAPEDFQDSARSTLRELLGADRYDLAACLGTVCPSYADTFLSWQPTAVQIALLAQPTWLLIWEQDLARLEPPEKPIGFFEVRIIPPAPTTKESRFQCLVARASELALDSSTPAYQSTNWADWPDSSSDW